MAVEIRRRVATQHRCTDCGSRTKWGIDNTSGWSRDKQAHPCPKCSKPETPEPAKVECDAPEYHEPGAMGSWYRYCPRCGAALTTEGA